ncbi:hypothetical protein PRNP1_000547 [Phytophthora ramorum]
MDSKVWQRAAADLNPPGVPNSFRHAKNQQNIANVLLRREFGGSRRQQTVRAVGEDREENFWAESESAAKHQSRYFELPQTTKSTISIAISPDGKTFASTHGDHTVKIICIETGKVLQTLVGHPRTPWSVKFHPTDPRYVASGCLGFQVRFWDIETGRCLYVSTLRHAIISISFHPSGDILAIASGTCVYTWDYQHSCPRIAMFSYQTLRSVTFLPDPSKIMVGEANERYVRPQGQAPPSDLTVTLTMWDFDPSWAQSAEPLLTKKAMNNSRVILSHALIYNDGGFDISRCGRYLAICADFSLRQAEKETCHLAETAAGGVTSVKISPTSAYVLLGYGVRDRIQRETEFPVHRVTRIYRWEDMALLSHVESAMDDVNIALFSPICGGGFLYGTKQGKLRVCNTFRGDFHDEENCNVLDGPRRCHYDQNVNGDDDDDEDADLGEDDEEDEDEESADDEEEDMEGDEEDEGTNEGEDADMGE